MTLAFFKTFTVYQYAPTSTQWQTFSQKNIGISFSIPKEAKTNVFGQTDPKTTVIRTIIPLNNDQTNNLVFYVTPRADALKEKFQDTAQKTYDGNRDMCPTSAVLTPIKPIRIGKYEALKYELRNCEGNFDEFFLTDGKTVFELSLFSQKPLEESTRSLREKIIASFSFSQ
ncbi:hypothetical protein HY345_01080 [Candidatus Microgenomates bacterium]|nr:hypothetical protein [Candidatus Microgenomates bacterium]